MSSNAQILEGVVGFFDDPETTLEAMKKVTEANYESYDSYTPYPIHGMDDAMGLKRSPLPWITLAAGIAGVSLAFALQYWTSVVDWPVNVGGKPFNSWPAFVPVMFELTILFSGIFTLLGLLGLCRLPNTGRKVIDPSITRDRFAIMIDLPKKVRNSSCKPFEESEVTQFLQSLGAKDVRKVYEEGWF
ncbi:MAG: hypothetical protein CL678_04750 [Bdellovibrionaceae bacterium]|nr:hypothetical protein [Pseudobdellovibrionaceae bacterium]